MGKRVSRNEKLGKEYVNFMNVYLEVGHMMEINFEQIEKRRDCEQYFSPHAVLTESSKTTKFRIVSNAVFRLAQVIH